ncbi:MULTISPECIES: universal stress protein [Gracilibacillus]|uniref:Universal stress protein n=1 Tax=Gracilibacillus dipsosauri TaxID=178340 RepID=A0A317L601_9BACI|nr:universal stress protein [Gracilibacillus dipsosauri]PWU70380.1 universal stress protein [Gracilibacillus dipsosauri]
MYKKILLATDGSEHSVRAAEHAIEIAQLKNGTIDIVYVVDGNTSKTDVLHGVDKYEVKKEREEKIKPVKDKITSVGIPCETNILHGEPGPSIVEFANDNNYDLVVVGSRGLNKLQTMILGSVSHKILKRVQCPVLVVK